MTFSGPELRRFPLFLIILFRRTRCGLLIIKLVKLFDFILIYAPRNEMIFTTEQGKSSGCQTDSPSTNSEIDNQK